MTNRWRNSRKTFAFSTISTTGRYWHSLGTSCANTGTWCSVTSACWDFRSTGKRANSRLCRRSLFSVWSWTRLTRQRDSQRRASSQRPLWNFFRGSWAFAVSVAAAARVASYEAASALASRPSPEIFGLLIPNYKSYLFQNYNFFISAY